MSFGIQVRVNVFEAMSTLEQNECSFGNLLARCYNTANCGE